MRDYKDTLNLPATDFSMRANLTVRSRETLKKWAENDLYGGMLRANEGNSGFVAGQRSAVFQRQHPYGHGDE